MSLNPAAQRAVEWLEQQLAELAGIRNATPRDPSFKNWRQASLTTLQRIWPGDQERSERFRRIPFSPVDPRADARTIREWYSRGCQEATRVLNGFIEDVRQHGVPDQPVESAAHGADAQFETDFPIVDLPAGDLSAVATEPAAASSSLSEFVDDVAQAPAPGAPAPPSLPSGIPAISNPVAAVRAQETPLPRKGVGARLKDLLGFAQLSAKALAGFPRDAAPPSSLPSLDAPVSASRPSLDVMPLGGAVSSAQGRAPSAPSSLPPPPAAEDVPHAPRMDQPLPTAPPTLAVALPEPGTTQPGASMSGLWPVPRPGDDATIGATLPVQPPPPPVPPVASAPPAPAANAPPAPMSHEPGVSVVMSRPTTLRSAIEKVSIESLLSDQFRTPAEEQPAASASQEDSPEALEQMVNEMLSAESAPAAPPAPAEPPAPTAPIAASAPATPGVSEPAAGANTTRDVPSIPLFEKVRTAPAPRSSTTAPAAPAAPTQPEPASPAPTAASPAPPPAAPAGPQAAQPGSHDAHIIDLPPRHRAPREETPDAGDDSAVGKVDPDAFARATEDFMRSSPVLGATGRKVNRPDLEETGFSDPDAIAVASMMQELSRLDVPAGRQPEVRARLLDLARRIESGELEWTSLRKAVWFAMEYPEIARRLMPVLLPWIDRAA